MKKLFFLIPWFMTFRIFAQDTLDMAKLEKAVFLLEKSDSCLKFYNNALSDKYKKECMLILHELFYSKKETVITFTEKMDYRIGNVNFNENGRSEDNHYYPINLYFFNKASSKKVVVVFFVRKMESGNNGQKNSIDTLSKLNINKPFYLHVKFMPCIGSYNNKSSHFIVDRNIIEVFLIIKGIHLK